MDLRTWLADDIDLVRDRLDAQVWAQVPAEERALPVDGGGSSITFLAWHTARHAEVALAVLRGGEPATADWHERLGLGSLEPGAGIPEAEDPEVTARTDPVAVAAYLDAVLRDARSWTAEVDLAVLERPVDAAPALERAGVPAGTFPWLEGLWSSRPAGFLVRWELIGHPHGHLGEMISLRNRLGRSPF